MWLEKVVGLVNLCKYVGVVVLDLKGGFFDKRMMRRSLRNVKVGLVDERR